MNYPAKEFDGMRFNVDTDKSLVEAFPELLNYEEIKAFYESGNNLFDKILKWVFLVYDRRSPFYKDFKDDMQRKYKAAFALEFPSEKGNLNTDTVDIINGKNDEVNDVILCCCYMLNSPKYALLIAVSQGYYKNLKDIASGKIKLSEEKVVYDQLKKMEELTSEILAEDKTQYLRENSYQFIETRRIHELAPEHVAKKRANKKKVTI